MGKPAYLLTNMVTAGILTGANITSGFPLSNLADGFLGTTTRWDGGGGNLNAHMATSPQLSYDSVFIGNHNLSATENFAISANPGITTTTSEHDFARLNDVFINLTTIGGLTQNANYLNVNFATSRSPIEIGEFVVGKRVLLPRAPKWGINKTQVDRGISVELPSGIQYDYELGSYQMVEPTFRFPESEYEAFKAFSVAVGRSLFVYIPDVDQNAGYYVKKARGFDPRPLSEGPGMDGASLAHWYDWTLSMRTDSYGLSIP